MSKEQLETGFVIETAKREVVIAKGINNTRDYVNLPIDLVLVLIEQAERVQEYDKELISLEGNKHYVSEILAKNKRYREAIENVLEIENYGVATDYIKTVTNILLEALEDENE